MPIVTTVDQEMPYALYRPPAQRVQPANNAGAPVIPHFLTGINDAAVLPFVAGLVLGSTLR